MQKVHCEWGPNGVEILRDRVAVVVIVDVLSFSTAVDVAVHRHARIHPFPYGDEDAARAEAARLGVRLAASRKAGGQLSLSPASLMKLNPGERLLLPSPNGSRLSLACGKAIVLAGCLRNAQAVAAKARALAEGGDVAVIPAGERWADGSLRPAIEDLIGAGAIIEALDLPGEPEALVAREAFRSAKPHLGETLRGCRSGQELIGREHAMDVEIALELNVSHCAPLLKNGAYEDAAA
ncbi:2-phosphosulfolactate phosphatase [Phenylobacterium sp. Root700]|uniref:2-phosphosulfolactate phosphatase n=1 Tax=Phenylobacterium sp. Root700 TaxID=1736591 RepID=UPI0006F8EE8F|nr:2-phosphosulfolactate phosphatase [Phenylobacterium sp. Root700]KRB44621.1 2-phosphosulfolactate phosphatase [Phenylobacterium sp. Root700]